VFTARYALSPYIKQICFVFKGLNLYFLSLTVELLIFYFMLKSMKTNLKLLRIYWFLHAVFPSSVLPAIITLYISWHAKSIFRWETWRVKFEIHVNQELYCGAMGQNEIQPTFVIDSCKKFCQNVFNTFEYETWVTAEHLHSPNSIYDA
jgi:hypothetical protein